VINFIEVPSFIPEIFIFYKLSQMSVSHLTWISINSFMSSVVSLHVENKRNIIEIMRDLVELLVVKGTSRRSVFASLTNLQCANAVISVCTV